MDHFKETQTCRLCLSTSNQQINIFNDLETNTNNVAEVISEHIGEVNVSDALPKTVCVECWNTTEAFHRFHLSVKSAQSAYLKSSIKLDSVLELDEDEFFVGETEDIKSLHLDDVTDVSNELTKELFVNEQCHALNNLEPTASNQTKCQNSEMDYMPTPHTIKVENFSFDDAKLQEVTFEDSDNDSDNVSIIYSHNCSGNENEPNDAPATQNADSTKAKEMVSRKLDGSCDICQFKLETLQCAIVHYKKEHRMADGYVRCCGLKLNSQKLFDDHVKWHLNPNIFKCEICNTILKTDNSLYKHVNRHKECDNFVCDLCGKIFLHKAEIRTHLQRSHANTFECGQCSKRYWNKQKFAAHERLAHGSNVLVNIVKQRHELKRKRVTPLSANKSQEIMAKHFDMTCDVCGDSLKSLQQAEYHYMHEHQQPDGYIKCCGIKFRKIKNINDHIASHVDPEVFKCSICTKAMPTLRCLQFHLYKHERSYKPKPFACVECDRSFQHKIGLTTHLQNVHAIATDKKNKTGIGAVKSTNSTDCSTKQLSVADFFDMTCDVCSATFTSLQHAKLHYWDEHENDNGYIKCCNLKFKEQKEVSDHLEYHINPETFKCNICDKLFLKQSALSGHIVMHKIIATKRFVCDVCEKVFRSNSQLNDHKQRHNPEKIYSCALCDKRFGSEQYRNRHQKDVHTEVDRTKTEICEFCAKTFYTRSQVLTHIRLKHLKVRTKIQCEVCKAWLANRYSLNCHMLRHTAEPQKCPQCDKIARNKDALAGHIRSVHTERIHKCKLCNKSFKAAIALKSHMATHTGEKVYTCSFCPVGFSWGTDKYKHQKKAHPEEWSQSQSKKRSKL